MRYVLHYEIYSAWGDLIKSPERRFTRKPALLAVPQDRSVQPSFMLCLPRLCLDEPGLSAQIPSVSDP